MEEEKTTIEATLDFSPATHHPIPPGEVMIVPELPPDEINWIHDQMNGEGHNLMLARETVKKAIKSRQLNPKDLQGKNFPETKIPLTHLLDHNSTFNKAELNDIEDQLISPLTKIFKRAFNDFIDKENKKHEGNNEPLNHSALPISELLNKLKKTKQEESFSDFGSTWLKEQIKPEETTEKQTFITNMLRKLGLK